MRQDEINYAFQNLLHRRLRSGLSILSILIGIMSIFALVSFGLGMQNYVNTLASQMGTDKLFIEAKSVGAPGTDSNFFISADDVNYVSKINGVSDTVGMYMKPADITSRQKTKYAFLSGLDIEKIDFINEAFAAHVEIGRELKKGELGKVALGYNYRIDNKIFAKGLKVGDKVKIGSLDFDVVGFYTSIGNPNDDANIYVTKEQFEQLYPDEKDKFGFVMVRSATDVSPKDLAKTITEKLRKHKGETAGNEDFYVQTFEDALATFTTILNVINGILVLIALISVVVASVNIMNTMYTAVMERTGEIGVMKAVGARNSDILFIFIFESGLIGAVGGILGVIAGYIVASIGGGIAVASGYAMLQPIFPWTLIVFCILFSFLVGAAAGIMPAWQASKLKPVDALRYE